MYTLYLFYISYFSGKMQAYLRYKQIPHRCVEPSWWQLVDQIMPATGWMKVPVVHTPDGDWLQDSTPMIDWFEREHPEGAVLPEDPVQAFLCRLLEDYADEWLWRPALHYRWSYKVDADLLSRRFTHTFLSSMPTPRWLTRLITLERQHRIYVRGDGINEQTRTHVEGIYLRNLDWLQAILEKQPFLMGARPCLADFGFFASMFRHFSLDPTPSEIMRERAPAVFAWVARLWAARYEVHTQAWPEIDDIPAGWSPILQDIGEAYLPYLHANAKACRDGRKRFDITVQGVMYCDLPAVPYRAWCRERLQHAFGALAPPTQARLETILREHGVWEPLWQDEVIASGYHQAGVTPPLCQPRRVGTLHKLWLYFTGTHWFRPKTALSSQNKK